MAPAKSIGGARLFPVRQLLTPPLVVDRQFLILPLGYFQPIAVYNRML
jgi:hypothetical protein